MKIYEKYVELREDGTLPLTCFRIVNDPIKFPRGMPHDAENLIRALCTKDLTRRLGNISGGAGRVKNDPFFNGISWEDIYHRRELGPIVPHLRGATDCSNFDEYPPEDKHKDVYTSELQRHYEHEFKDF